MVVTLCISKPPPPTPVNAEPSIAGKAPVKLADAKEVKAEPSIAVQL